MATVRLAGSEAVCRVHNLSHAGAMIETDRALAKGSTVELELSARHRLAARVMWQQDGRAGLQYRTWVDCCSIIREIADDHWSARAVAKPGFDV